ncbi:DER1-domain-containing protein [Fonsecaea pedrosoi]|nr:DER1-domain-containing protein [Fonsecaea pedrosoi]
MSGGGVDIMDRFWSTPPVTRTIVAAMFVESALVHSGLVSGMRIVYHTPWLFKFPPELWRLLSSFLLTGGGFSFVFDLYFMYTYASGLELNSPRFAQPGDFFTYIFFVATAILLKRFLETREITPVAHKAPVIRKSVNRTLCGTGMVVAPLRKLFVKNQFACGGLGFLQPNKPSLNFYFVPKAVYNIGLLTWDQASGGLILGGHVFTQALLLALIYTFAQDNRGKKAHFIILQIPVELLPWAMLTLTLIMGGPQAALQQATGVFAAHLYDFLTRLYPTFQGGRNYIQTPAAVKRYFGADRSSFTHKAYGTSFRPGQPVPQQQSRGWTSGFSNSWSGRGAGRRLGGD